MYWDNVLGSNSVRLVSKNGWLRYTARLAVNYVFLCGTLFASKVGNRIMVFSTALWKKCWIP